MTTMTRDGLGEQLAAARGANAELRAENSALLAQLEGDIPKATAWLMRKVLRQRAAINALQHKNGTLHFMLRCYARLRKPITQEEYVQARSEIQDKQLKSRIAEDLPATEDSQ